MTYRLLGILLLVGWLSSCDTANTPPVAMVFSVPGTGDTSTLFLLEGNQSTDAETSVFALRYRWDTDADGTWDTGFSERTSFTARFSKTGYRKYILEVSDTEGLTSQVTDSVLIIGMNSNTGEMTDSRDGRTYQTVRIGNDWWMAENLQYGKPIDAGTRPTNNGEAEYLLFHDSSTNQHYGSLYTWEEVHQYPSSSVFRDICPPGWRIPTQGQWSGLIKKYPQPFDVLYYLGKSSIENLGVGMTGYFRYGDPDHPLSGEFTGDTKSVRYWTSTYSGSDSTRLFAGIHFSRDSAYFVQTVNRAIWVYHPQFPLFIIGHKSPEACYVRCIKPLL